MLDLMLLTLDLNIYNMFNLTLLTLVGCYIMTLIKPFTVSSGLAVDWKMVIILLQGKSSALVCLSVYLLYIPSYLTRQRLKLLNTVSSTDAEGGSWKSSHMCNCVYSIKMS